MQRVLRVILFLTFFVSTPHLYAGFNFDLKTLSGGSVSSSSLKGKVAIVDFWATWCTVCRTSFKFYQGLYDQYKDKGLTIVAINTDAPNVSEDKIKDFVEGTGASFDVALGGKSLADGQGVSAMPTSYILDRNGTVIKTYSGFHESEKTEVEAKIKELLGEK